MLFPENIRRVFLAVPAPPETWVVMEELKERTSAHKALKWMRPQNLHLTVFFVGNIEYKLYAPVLKQCEEVVSSFPPFNLTFDGLAMMPSRKPHMLWAKYKTNGTYTQMYHSIHNKLKPFMKSISTVYEHPVPHITLARFHGLKDFSIPGTVSDIILPQVHVNKVCMWETENKSGQSDYFQDSNCLIMKSI